MSNQVEVRPRVIVCTDISTVGARKGEPDDTQSLVRFLLYANHFDVEGLIATSASHDDRVHPDYIRSIVSAYGRVRDNLALHDPAYPTARYLLDRVKAGADDRNALGPGCDTEASDWIISAVEKPDPRPIWIVMWGGARELAQAISKMERGGDTARLAAFRSKVRVYAIGDQDAGCAWIKTHHPNAFYITARHAYRGMYRDGDTSLCTRDWVQQNVTTGHGALGAAYPNYDGGDPWGAVKGIKEGDTPSFLYLIPNGLGNPEQPAWGSWGGRFSGPGPQYTDAKDVVGGENSERATVYRWRAAYQADFRARLDWCVKPFDKANHAPTACVTGPPSRKVASGGIAQLDATGSTDPDGDKLACDWYFYREPSSYRGELAIEHGDNGRARFRAPRVDSPQTIHIILTVTDDGFPALRGYRRVVVTVEPGQ
ncbi:MAG: DUF1593 domain-containing protein [Armatimonadota bacterium]|nr:DUF1593 domain-containing protein [Armatimonadota bacterium]